MGLHLVKGALMEPWRIMALWSHVLLVQISFALTVHVAVGRSVWMSRFMLSVSVSASSLTISTNFYKPFGSLLFLFFFHLTFHHVVLGLLRAASTGLYFAPILFLKPGNLLRNLRTCIFSSVPLDSFAVKNSFVLLSTQNRLRDTGILNHMALKSQCSTHIWQT